MFASSMVRLSGMTALGMAVSLTNLSCSDKGSPTPVGGTSYTGSAQSPAPGAASVYHPTPIRPYVPSYDSALPIASAPGSTDTTRPIVYETEDWFQKKDSRWMFFGFASLIVLLTTAGIFHVINKHKDELDGPR